MPIAPDPTEAVAVAAAEAAPERPEFPGVVTSRSSRVITADFQGRIERLMISSRKRVKAGDVVAKLDDTELRAEHAQLLEQERGARLDAGGAGAAYAQARREAKAQQRLYDKGVAARNSYRSSVANASSLGAQAAGLRAKADALKFKRKQVEDLLAKAQLVSPIDGVVTIVKAKEGQVADKGTPIARVFDDSDLIIRFAVDKEYRDLVAEGQRVELTLDGVERPVWATIETIALEEPPIDFATVVADIDDSKLGPDEVRVASEGRVRIAEARGAKP